MLPSRTVWPTRHVLAQRGTESADGNREPYGVATMPDCGRERHGWARRVRLRVCGKRESLARLHGRAVEPVDAHDLVDDLAGVALWCDRLGDAPERLSVGDGEVRERRALRAVDVGRGPAAAEHEGDHDEDDRHGGE